MKALAFAPGHISAFFEPVYKHQNLEYSGSRGAGMSLSLGALSQVTIQSSSQQTISVYINETRSQAPVTTRALRHLVGETPIQILVDTRLDLPVSQGFGMSASGALSATLAAAKILTLSREDAIRAAHCAEVESRTGLGDVIACSFGGIEIRREPGLPPWGMLEHIPGLLDVVICVIGKRMMTKKILSNAVKIEEIASYGRYCTKKLLDAPSIEHLFSLGYEFTKKSGLADPQVMQAIEAANQQGMASMCMLGNSVFAVGNIPMLQKTLSAFGNVWVCSVNTKGAQIVDIW